MELYYTLFLEAHESYVDHESNLISKECRLTFTNFWKYNKNNMKLLRERFLIYRSCIVGCGGCHTPSLGKLSAKLCPSAN